MNKTILIVDDDKDILDAMTMLLEDAGYDVISSEDGVYLDELDRAQQRLPDVVILDLLLSGRSGKEILAMLRKNEKTKDLPVILNSAHPDAKRIARESGATDFIAKPFTISDLLMKIERSI